METSDRNNNLSLKVLYCFLVFCLLILIGLGVYALTGSWELFCVIRDTWFIGLGSLVTFGIVNYLIKQYHDTWDR